jgi:hypothetical protein
MPSKLSDMFPNLKESTSSASELDWNTRRITDNSIGTTTAGSFPPIWNTPNTILDDIHKATKQENEMKTATEMFIKIADPSGEFFDGNTATINNTFIFSRGDILEKYDLPKDRWTIQSATDFLKWLGTVQLLLK